MNKKLINPKGLLALAGLALVHASSHAAPFVYSPGDLMLDFRSSSGSTDFEVDLGSISTYANASGSISISQYTTTQLNAVFSTLDSLTFSVVGGVPSGQSIAGYSANTLFLTSARSDITTQTTPITQKSAITQSTINSKIQGIGNGAVSYSANNPGAAVNTASAVAVVNTDPSSYETIAGTVGNLKNTYSGNVENTTGTGFASSGSPIVSDLYAAAPVSGQPATYLGNFSLNNDGSMTFTPANVPEPSTWAMIGIGGLVLLSQFRRKTQAA